MTDHSTRLDAARKLADGAGIDALVITPGANLRYLTGYDALPLERLTALVLPTNGEATLVVPRLERPAAEACLRLRPKAPVGARIAHAIEIADGNAYPDVVVLAAGLEQEHAGLRIGGQTIGEHAAGGAAADDDEIEGVGLRSRVGHVCTRSSPWAIRLRCSAATADLHCNPP